MVCDIACPVALCDGLDEQSCLQRGSACQADYCPGCNGAKDFVGCFSPGTGGQTCGAPQCPPAQSCDQLTTEADCQARSDCHAVFEDPGTCGCATLGCCMVFNHCAAGVAQCVGQPVCTVKAPVCGGQFVTAYINGCYEGCVLSSECH
jgi:hypothetical protein